MMVFRPAARTKVLTAFFTDFQLAAGTTVPTGATTDKNLDTGTPCRTDGTGRFFLFIGKGCGTVLPGLNTDIPLVAFFIIFIHDGAHGLSSPPQNPEWADHFSIGQVSYSMKRIHHLFLK
jgi:hypothetical protein